MTVRTLHQFLVITALAGFLHLVLGWEWTVAAGLVAGLWIERRAWLVAAAAVGADYLILVLFSYLSNAAAVSIMTATLGGLLGNMPSFAVVAVTVLIGVVLGGFSGAAGAQLRAIAFRRREAAPSGT